MKSKTLIGIAVASAFGWSAAAYAGPGHDKWVAAGEEHYPAMVFGTEQPRGASAVHVVDVLVIEPIGGTFSSYESAVSGSYPSDEALSLSSSDELSSLSMDESLALADEGIYSDFIVTSVPVTFESWDLYVLDTSSITEDQLAALDDYMIMPYDLAVIQAYDMYSDEA